MRSHPAHSKYTYEAIDRHIREGRTKHARSKLQEIFQKKIPRPEIATIASLARRAGLASKAIQLLNPIARPHPKSPIVPTAREKAEYAECLTRAGAAEEALEILDSLSHSNYPLALLYLASAHVTRWDYEKAIPLLVRFLRSTHIEPYWKWVGRTNLAASLVFLGKHKEATQLLNKLIHETSLRHLPLLLANSLELAAQNFISQKRWNDAETCLKRAETLLANSESLDEFFVRKWYAIVSFVRTRGQGRSADSLRSIRSEAVARSHWETVRQCDQYFAVTLHDEKLFLHLYIGTPFESFRKQLLQHFSGKWTLPEIYHWHLDGGSPSGSATDLLGSKPTQGTEGLRAGHLLHRLATLLTLDFYRPFRLPTIHFHLYPKENFNPITSPPRIHEATKRLRTWMESSQIPLTVYEQQGGYFLKALKPLTISLHTKTRHLCTPYNFALDSLRERWPNDPFSIHDAAQALQKPVRTTLRILDSARHSHTLTREGATRSTRYRFK